MIEPSIDVAPTSVGATVNRVCGRILEGARFEVASLLRQAPDSRRLPDSICS